PQPRPSPPAPHTFRERSLRRGTPCGGCGTPLGPHGLVCRVCKIAAHKRCESKVTTPCQPLPPPELVSVGGRDLPRPSGQDPRPLERPSRRLNPSGMTQNPRSTPEQEPPNSARDPQTPRAGSGI
ncbi:TNS2 protein, partial [Bombycilla garrulus]|nr:TNS2 protein [Bombycilla garrulus]